MILKIFFALAVIVTLAETKSYENYKVYSVVPSSNIEVQLLEDLRKSGYQFWNDYVTIGSDVRIMVAPQNTENFRSYCKGVGLHPILSISNVQELIDAQLKPAQRTSDNDESFSWKSYHTLAEIYAWLDELENLYPNIVETVTIGTTLEGRSIKGVIIDKKRGQRDDVPLTAMIEGGIHAREWISPATVTWIINEFITSSDVDVRFLADTFVWHIFPVVNPDGYVYTFTRDRMWRKNRNPANYVNCSLGDDIGNGIDLNRNFDYLWLTTGASSDPCDQTYAGPSPDSELETRAISNYVRQIQQNGNLIYYFAFHSYSQMVLIPYSHAAGTGVLEVENYADLYEVAIRGAEKLEAVHGTAYTVGTAAEILYEVSGSSFDWVKGVANVPITLLFELRGKGKSGFLLPKEEIIPNNEEIMSCLLEMDRATRTLGYYSSGQGVLASILILSVNALLLAVVY